MIKIQKGDIRKLFIFLFICVCLCFGLEYSLRIKSLGTDFAYLIPDYETDLYLNPNLLGEKLTGVSYEPGLNMPMTFRILSTRFGWYGQYWGNYRNNKLIDARPINNTTVVVKDLWMLDLRRKLPKFIASNIWNLYNDGGYSGSYFYWSDDYYDTTKTIKYLTRVNSSYRIGNHWTAINRLCIGPYYYYKYARHLSDEQSVDQWLIIYSGRIGLFYRNVTTNNKFVTSYIDIGGPISTADIDNLPYSVFSHVSEKFPEIVMTPFANAFIAKFGFAKSFPVDENGCVVAGWYDNFLFQQTEQADTNITLRGINNRLSFPIALEWICSKLTFRFGTNLLYNLNYRREWDNDSTFVRVNEHTLNFAYTFGFAWQPNEHFVIDLYNIGNLAQVNNWAIYLKYLP